MMKMIRDFKLAQHTKEVIALNIGVISRRAYDILEKILEMTDYNDGIGLWRVNYSNSLYFSKRYQFINELGETLVFFEPWWRNGNVTFASGSMSDEAVKVAVVETLRNIIEDFIKTSIKAKDIKKGVSTSRLVEDNINDARRLLKFILDEKEDDALKGVPFNPFITEVYREKLKAYIKSRDDAINCHTDQDKHYIPIEKQMYYEIVNLLND